MQRFASSKFCEIRLNDMMDLLKMLNVANYETINELVNAIEIKDRLENGAELLKEFCMNTIIAQRFNDQSGIEDINFEVVTNERGIKEAEKYIVNQLLLRSITSDNKNSSIQKILSNYDWADDMVKLLMKSGDEVIATFDLILDGTSIEDICSVIVKLLLIMMTYNKEEDFAININADEMYLGVKINKKFLNYMLSFLEDLALYLKIARQVTNREKTFVAEE